MRRPRFWRCRSAALALLLTACAAPAPQKPPLRVLEGVRMGTTWRVVLAPPDAHTGDAALRARLDAELERLDHLLSTWRDDSDLSRLNAALAAGDGTRHCVDPELAQVLSAALARAAASEGAFDPTVAPLARLWSRTDDGQPRRAPPSPSAVARAQAQVGWREIRIWPDAPCFAASTPRSFDVSAIAPGHVVDQLAARLRDAGVVSALVELGGEFRAVGRRPDGQPWRVAIETPPSAAPQAALDWVVALDGRALGTSGDYRAGFTHAGRHYPHTLDPRTGEPVRHALAAVTVIADRAIDADALAATLMVLGPDDGWSWAQVQGLAAVFTVRSAAGLERRATPQAEALRAR